MLLSTYARYKHTRNGLYKALLSKLQRAGVKVHYSYDKDPETFGFYRTGRQTIHVNSNPACQQLCPPSQLISVVVHELTHKIGYEIFHSGRVIGAFPYENPYNTRGYSLEEVIAESTAAHVLHRYYGITPSEYSVNYIRGYIDRYNTHVTYEQELMQHKYPLDLVLEQIQKRGKIILDILDGGTYTLHIAPIQEDSLELQLGLEVPTELLDYDTIMLNALQH